MRDARPYYIHVNHPMRKEMKLIMSELKQPSCINLTNGEFQSTVRLCHKNAQELLHGNIELAPLKATES